jgi:ABC-2 type transport system permease protein
MLKYLLEKEFKQFFRNPFLPKLVMVFPLFFIMILPLAANFEIKNIYLSIVDNNRSTFSRRLVRKILSSGYFRLAGESSGYKTALRDIELDRADIILEIPGSFEQDLIREKEARVMISANSVNGIKGGLGSAYLSGIIADFSSEIREELAPQVPGMIVPSIEVVPEYRYNPFLRYPIFMIPALMVMLLTLLCGFLPALNIVMEKESGTIEQINVTPVKKTLFILSRHSKIVLRPCTRGQSSYDIYFFIGFYSFDLRPGTDHLKLCQHNPAGNVYIILLYSKHDLFKRSLYACGKHARVGAVYQ